MDALGLATSLAFYTSSKISLPSTYYQGLFFHNRYFLLAVWWLALLSLIKKSCSLHRKVCFQPGLFCFEFVCSFSACTGSLQALHFLPQSKHIHARLIGDSKMFVGACLALRALCWTGDLFGLIPLLPCDSWDELQPLVINSAGEMVIENRWMVGCCPCKLICENTLPSYMVFKRHTH